MTPQEKAKELVDKFYSQISGISINYVSKMITIPNGDSYYKIAKECAKIAVQEIIDAIDWSKSQYALYFWNEVLTEIENL